MSRPLDKWTPAKRRTAPRPVRAPVVVCPFGPTFPHVFCMAFPLGNTAAPIEKYAHARKIAVCCPFSAFFVYAPGAFCCSTIERITANTEKAPTCRIFARCFVSFFLLDSRGHFRRFC